MPRRTHRKAPKRKSSRRKTYAFRRSRVAPTRAKIMGGGSLSSATFSNNDVSASPQSYIPYNNFSNDPGYSVINARGTGPFLTGTSGGGRSRRIMKGGNDVSSSISAGLNAFTNNLSIIPAPAVNESSGVAGVMSGFSGTGSAYSSTPLKIAPIA